MAFAKLFVSALGLMPFVASGHPSGNGHKDALHNADVIIYDSSVKSATRVAQVIVWADKTGKPVVTTTEKVLLLPTRLALQTSSKANATTSAPVAPSGTKTLLMPATGSEAPTATGKTDSAAAEPLPAIASPVPAPNSSAASGGQSGLFGVSYAPYRADQGCKSQQDVEHDFSRMAGAYSLVRIYGTDCNQVAMVHSAAKANGMKVFLGIWNPFAVQEEANKIISGVNGDWSMVHTVSVGNERVNNGEASPQDMTRAVDEARSILRAAGYAGPVVTVDTFTAALAHPELCGASDYCAVNAHAFFDSSNAAEQSGQWLQNTVSNIRSKLSADKKIVVTETGWPMQGATNGAAVPSLENQKLALDSIKTAFADNPESVILFSAFNDLWKQRDMATFNAEQFWGIGGAISKSDQ